MRRVAELFEPVEFGRLRRIGRGIGVDDDDSPARRADPDHLAEHGWRVGKVVDREAGDDDRERPIPEGQARNVAFAPRHVRDALLGG